MNKLYYDMIFKRKSFHIFTGQQKILFTELNEIKGFIQKTEKLNRNIKVDCKVVPRGETSCKRGEYCILLFSEKKENYLQNIGYIGEQLDLWLTSKNIGVCWYGMGKTEEASYNDLSFVIMLAIERVSETEFRKDMFKSKRKLLEEIWEGDDYNSISSIVRYAPSACNTQPWYVKSTKSKIDVYRIKKQGKRGMMPIDKVIYYNRIDIGIFMLFIEICLEHGNIGYKRELFDDISDDNNSVETLNASYYLDGHIESNNRLDA